MEEFNNFSELIKIFMDNVKKEISSKAENKGNQICNKKIIDFLFNILDYQITLINQIFLFNENNKENNENNVENLIKVNKDILVSMIDKFLFNLNPMTNKTKINGKNKYNLIHLILY